MIHKLYSRLSSRLGIKLFTLLTVVITLSIVPLAYTSLKAIDRYGNDVSAVNEDQIRSQAFAYLKKVARERASRYQVFFDRIRASAGMLGSQASAIYSDTNIFATSPLHRYHYTIQPYNGFWANTISDPVISVYWGAPELSSEIKSELDALTHLTPLMERVLAENPEVLASHVITLSGIGQYCTKNLKSKEMALNLPPLSVVDLRDGEPLGIFNDPEDITAEVRWTNVYKDDASNGLALTASAPIIDENRQFRGIAGIDVPLRTIREDILNIDDLDPVSTVLFAFLIDNNGRLIAFPENYYARFGLTFDPGQYTDSSDSLELSLNDSARDDVRNFGAMITSGQETFSKLELDDESLLVATSRLPDLHWVLGLVVRQSDMFASVEKSRVTLKKTIRAMEINGLILSLFTVFSALLIIYLSVKHLVNPLRTLADATKRVAGGDLSVRCPVVTRDETGVLAQSFNLMVERLQIAQERQQQYADSLEVEVEQRNRELVEKKTELETTIELLNDEVERRQIISEALRNSQQQYYETLEANKAGIYIITDGLFSYVNQSLADLLHTSPQEIVGLNPLDFVSQEDKTLVAENMEKRISGIDIPPYRVKCLAVDGSTFYGEVWAKTTTWQNRTAMVGTITDVTNIWRNEEKIRVQEIQLRKSLEEKEILLKEIYHRTKNNMLVIISMLELQAIDIDDDRVKSIFKDTEHRIRAMALVHEKLYQSQDLSKIDLGSYLKDVVHSLVGNMVLAGKISLDIEMEPTPINIDYAVPLGLVINEIVTNSVKHAFPGKRTGTISLQLSRGENKTIRLEICDDGVGLPEHLDIHESSSLGIQLVNSLVTAQLGGDISVQRSGGTKYVIVFRELFRKTRI